MNVVFGSQLVLAPLFPPTYCVNEAHSYKGNGDFKISKNPLIAYKCL